MAVTGVSPSAGPLAGGTSVTITGTGLAGPRQSISALSQATIVSDTATQIVATSPAEAAGTVNITVTSSAGTTPTSSSDKFTYEAAPPVTSVTPSAGPLSGWHERDDYGHGSCRGHGGGFRLCRRDDRQRHGNTDRGNRPGGDDGRRCQHRGDYSAGTSTTSSGDEFTYDAAPTVSGVSPVVGTSGTLVTITGTNLTGATAVDFGSAAATNVVVVSATEVTATIPPEATGATNPVNITVTTPGGVSAISSSDDFTYMAVTGVSPAVGALAGGTSVTITGTGLAGATAVDFGSVAGTIVSDTATQIVATSPAEAAGTVNITVTSSAGTTPTSTSDQFTYVAAPAVTGVSPVVGSVAGDTTVTIIGTGFVSGQTTVDFGTVAGTDVSVNAAGTQITATSPAESAGTVDVRVTTPLGTSAITTADKFTYESAPAPMPRCPCWSAQPKLLKKFRPHALARDQLHVPGRRRSRHARVVHAARESVIPRVSADGP